MAELFGGGHTTNLQLTNWYNPAWVFAGPGQATVSVTIDSSVTLADVTPAQQTAFDSANGITAGIGEFATLTLAPNGPVYNLGGPISSPGPQTPVDGLLNVSLTGGGSSDVLDASGYSGSVTFHNSAGGGVMKGGTGSNTFVFDADNAQGSVTLIGDGGTNTLDFSSTQNATVPLGHGRFRLSNGQRQQAIAHSGQRPRECGRYRRSGR